MIYIKDIKLPIREYKHPLEMYPSLGLQDMQPARYRAVGGITADPDICALPPLLAPKELMMDNMHTIADYNPATAGQAARSDRLAALATFKDKITVYMPFHLELERRFQNCLVSAYSRRSLGCLSDEDKNIVSIAQPIATSVQDMSLIGTAGTGKSTAVRLMLDRYPRAIQHELNSCRYVQVPFLEVTTREGDIKSVFLDLVMGLDRVLGTDIYEQKMRKMGTVAKMESYLVKLIQNFHIGAIVIDEIQSVLQRKESMFTHLLSITASAGVSVMIIGTESAVDGLNKNMWFSRRFSQLGQVQSDIRAADSTYIDQVIRTIWSLQWTHKRYPLTDSILSTLSKASHNNIDFLTTIIVTAQTLCIKSEGKSQELDLDASTIKMAADKYPVAQRMLEAGVEALEAAYISEKHSAMDAISRDAQNERAKEQKALLQTAVTAFANKGQLLSEVFDACEQAGFGDDRKLIERICRAKMASGDEFLALDRKQQAKVVIAALMEQASKRRVKANTSPKEHASAKQKKSNKAMLGSLGIDEHDEHGLDELQAAVS